jgi:hypothetical protein
MEPRFYLGLLFGRPVLLPANQPEPTPAHGGGQHQGYGVGARKPPHDSALDSIDRLRVLVEFFVEKHNTQMPHAAFQGQTPDEMYFGTAVDLPAQLAMARSKTRAERLAANRVMTCDQCSGQQAGLPASPISP